MTRDNDAVGEKIKAPVPLVIRGVSEEKTTRRARGKFVRRGGMGNRLGGKAVEEIGGYVQGLRPVAGGKRSLKEEATQHIGGGVNHTLGSAILRGGVRARHLQLHAMGEKQGTRNVVIKLTPIIALNNLDGTTELS
jgi:hypothetical protein